MGTHEKRLSKVESDPNGMVHNFSPYWKVLLRYVIGFDAVKNFKFF